MFRKFLLSVAASLALVALPAFTPSAAQAGGGSHGHSSRGHGGGGQRSSGGGYRNREGYRGDTYYVYYRESPYSPWVSYGSYSSYSEASGVADGLIGNGSQAFVR